MESMMLIVADRSRAQLYAIRGSRLKPELAALETIEHPEVRHTSDPATSSSQRELMVDDSGATAEEDRRFVRQVVERLHAAQHRREFERFLIAAPADMIGKFRKASSKTLARSVHREIVGDYTNDSIHALQERLRRRKWLGR